MTNELLGMIKRFKQGINLSPECLAADIINRVGIGNQFLAEDHTYEHFRSESWEPDLFDRYRHEEWEDKGKKDLAERAKERIESILSEPKTVKLDQHQTTELAKIIKKREQNLWMCRPAKKMDLERLSQSIREYAAVFTQTSAETCRRAQVELLSRRPLDLVLSQQLCWIAQ